MKVASKTPKNTEATVIKVRRLLRHKLRQAMSAFIVFELV